MRTKIFLIILLAIPFFTLRSQTVYEHVSNKNIYDFIDELATGGIVEINSVIKPYSRMFIAEKLIEAERNPNTLTPRQKKELAFYHNAYKQELDSLPDYKPSFNLLEILFKNENKNFATAINPIGLFYKDPFFSFSIKPIWGINYFIKGEENIFHRWGGVEAHAYVGKHWGMYASLRDNTETELISAPEFFTQRGGGGNFKGSATGGVDFEEMRGGVVYSWNWGSFGLVKDHLNWGNNYHGPMIMNDRAPSFAQFKLNMKPVEWFELNYYHGWLVSMEIDSVRSYYSTVPPREVFRPKYIAANMMTIKPWKKLNVSFGNSIVYSDMNVHPAYLIPIMFYKAIDHTLNSGIDNQNSQMFFDISSRNINKLHLYATLYIDELKVDRLFNPDKHNFWSVKCGFKTFNFLIPNLSANVEYSMARPITYQHRSPTLTYESNYYNMGYYLRDNSREIFASLTYKPLRGLHLTASYMLAQHGPDYDYDLTGDVGVDTYPFLQYIVWENQTLSFKASYEFVSNAYVFAEFINSNISGDPEKVALYTPVFFRGNNTIISAGFNLGF